MVLPSTPRSPRYNVKHLTEHHNPTTPTPPTNFRHAPPRSALPSEDQHRVLVGIIFPYDIP
jgi:hypothetical protein